MAIRVRINPILIGGRAAQAKAFTRITKSLHLSLIRAWQAAALAFIRAAARRTAVDTGMSLATFIPLAKAIQRDTEEFFFSQINRGAGSRAFPGPVRELRTGKSIPNTVRGIAAGEAVGEKAFKFNVGNPERPIFQFSFITLVFQQALLEPRQKALIAGEKAFFDVAEARFRRAVEFEISNFFGIRPSARRLL